MIKLYGKSQILTKDETLSVYREGTNIPGNVVYVDGKPIKRNGISFMVGGTIQPLNGRDLLLVPEGDRFKEQYWLFVTSYFFKTDLGLEVQDKPTSLLVNDQITRLEVNFQVQEIEDWGSYCKARIMRIDVGPNATP